MLEIAIKQRSLSTLKILLDARADPNIEIPDVSLFKLNSDLVVEISF
jgi:hypothetical protein